MAAPAFRFLSLAEVARQTSLSPTTIYRYMDKDEFPKSVKLPGGYRVAWRSDDVEAWVLRVLERNEV
jgi:prophage regulatory protein